MVTLRDVMRIVGIRDVFVVVAPVHVRIALSLALRDVSLFPNRRERNSGSIARAFAQDGNAWGVRKFHAAVACGRKNHFNNAFACEDVHLLMLDALCSSDVQTVRAVLEHAYDVWLLDVGTARESVHGRTREVLCLLLTLLYHEPRFPAAGAFTCSRDYLELLARNTWRYNRTVKSVEVAVFHRETLNVERHTYPAPQFLKPQTKRARPSSRV
jgi:hypothetical protein